MRERKTHWPAILEGGRAGKTLCPANHGAHGVPWRRRIQFTYNRDALTCKACIAVLARIKPESL